MRSTFRQTTCFTLVITLIASCFVQAAHAGPFSISPVRIYMAPRDRAIAVTITNEGNEELVMQADLYNWMQKDNGEDELTLTEDMIMSPPILKLAPRSKQVVRLAMLRPRPPGEQLTYRMIVREIPEAKPATDNDLKLQIALAFSMPVFITPRGAKYKVACQFERTGAETAKANCENTGNAYTQVRSMVLNNAAGASLASSTISGGYMLLGAKRSFELKSAGGKIPAGNAKLMLTHDDGTSQIFDVTVAE